MQVKLTKLAIVAYADDLTARGVQAEADALSVLTGLFDGFLSKQFAEFRAIASRALVTENESTSIGEPSVRDALAPLERLATLMASLSPANRRQDTQALIKFLRQHESVKLATLVDAVQSARRGQLKRPAMTLNELKSQLDPSLGDDTRFKPILNQLKLLSEPEFLKVVQTSLRGSVKSKKDGIARLKALHEVARSNLMKEAAANGKSAA